MGCSKSRQLEAEKAKAGKCAAEAGGLGCRRQSRQRGRRSSRPRRRTPPRAGQGVTLTAQGVPQLPPPCDDIVTDICEFSEVEFAVAGVEGWVHVYDAELADLSGKLRAHRKAVNRCLSCGDRLLTASGDATVRVWRKGMHHKAGDDPAEPLQILAGHELSVRALDVLEGDSASAASRYRGSGSRLLMTGSRDCSVRLWDLTTGKPMYQAKVLRNIVTAIRRVPGEPYMAAQASEDLSMRLWDTRVGLRPAMEAQCGPNQVICLDVADDGRSIVGGTKGFSRENCEVKVFDVRSNLRSLATLACADQSIEALHLVGRERCVVAAKDGYLRGLSLPELQVVAERGPCSVGGYTAMGVQRRQGMGPVVLVAAAGSEGPGLELLEWMDIALEGEPLLLASTG